MSKFLEGITTPGARTLILFALMLVGAALCVFHVEYGLDMVKGSFLVLIAYLDPSKLPGGTNGKV